MVFILDNCRIHLSRLLKKADKFLNFLFLPPFFPQLNPIENFFSYLKSQLLKMFYSSEQQLLKNLKIIIKECNDSIFSGNNRNLLNTAKKVLNSEDI
jgi:transposase